MTARANASSSSVIGRLELDLSAAGRLPPATAALLAGHDRDLLQPLHLATPGWRPEGAPRTDRRSLAEALAEANTAYGHPRAEELAERLADPEALVVVTGQQPGLYGGPLLTLLKILAAGRWAEELAAAGRPAVPVFWVATEDHDWAEIASALLQTQDGWQRFSLGEDPAPLMPAGMRTFGPGVAEIARRLREGLAAPEPRSRLAVLDRWYRPESRFGEAFCRWMTYLLAERAPLFYDAMLPTPKALQRPWLRRFIERRVEVGRALEEGDRRIADRGYPLQVTPQREASPLFLLRGDERRRIEWVGSDRYRLRGADAPPAPVAELLAILEDNPTTVSAGVLGRPVVQDALFGTTLQVLGPSELAYMLQVAPLYRTLGAPAPAVALRPHAAVVSEREVGYLAEPRLTLERLFTEDPERLVAEGSGENPIVAQKRSLSELLDGLREPLLRLDPGLEKPWQKTRDQVARAVDQLAAKTDGAIARRHQVRLRRLVRVRATYLPEGELQERVISVAQLVAQYGGGFVGELADQLRLDPGILRTVVL